MVSRSVSSLTPKPLHRYGTRRDTIYEDPATDWLAEPDGQVVQVSRYCTKNIWSYDSRLGDEHDDDGRLLNDTRLVGIVTALRPNGTADESNGYGATPIPETRRGN